jgi:hypothetical protein
MLTKKIITVLLLSIVLISVSSRKASSQIDSEAVAILDTMSNVVTELESCSFTLKIQYDIYSERFGLIKNSDVSKVFLKAPDKLFITKKGDKGNKELYYDGKTLTYYSKDNHQYATVSAPPTIMETIDSVSNEFGIEFPAADIFYPDLIDSILANANNLSNLGLTEIDEKECFHIAGTNDDFTYQLWIANDGSFLPIKMAIVYTNKTANPQYEALFQNWNLNPVLEDSMFNFIVPTDARKIKILKNN